MSVAARTAAWQRRYGGTFTTPSASSPVYTPPGMSVVFNGSTHAPGYTITLTNMNQIVGAGLYAQYWTLVRVSPNASVWPDQVVRSGDFITQGPSGNGTYVLEDIEAPFLDQTLGPWVYTVQIYTSSSSHNGMFDLQAGIAQLESFVTTSPGQIYIKSIETSTNSLYAWLTDFRTWGRPGRVLSENAVLGRRNKVVLTDVGGGKEGTLKLIVMNSDSPSVSVFDYEDLLLSADTFLLQTTNYVNSGIKDTYFKVKNLKFDRMTKFNHSWTAAWFTSFAIEIEFIEVDRPATAIPTTLNTWQQVLDNNGTWTDVLNDHATWLDVLLNPTL